MKVNSESVLTGTVAENQYIVYTVGEANLPPAFNSGVLNSCAVLILGYIDPHAGQHNVMFAHLGGGYLTKEMDETLDVIKSLGVRSGQAYYLHNGSTNPHYQTEAAKVQAAVGIAPTIISDCSEALLRDSSTIHAGSNEISPIRLNDLDDYRNFKAAFKNFQFSKSVSGYDINTAVLHILMMMTAHITEEYEG